MFKEIAPHIRKATTRDLVGRTITAVRWTPIADGGSLAARTIDALVLDNGRTVYFQGVETEGGCDYAVDCFTVTRPHPVDKPRE
jgi:hypothetical protein